MVVYGTKKSGESYLEVQYTIVFFVRADRGYNLLDALHYAISARKYSDPIIKSFYQTNDLTQADLISTCSLVFKLVYNQDVKWNNTQPEILRNIQVYE